MVLMSSVFQSFKSVQTTHARFWLHINAVTHKRNVAPRPEDTLCPGDTIAVIGEAMFIKKLATDYGWSYSHELKVFADDLAPTNSGIMEGIVSPRSQFVGMTVRDIQLRKKFGVVPLAVYVGHEMIISDLSDLVCQ